MSASSFSFVMATGIVSVGAHLMDIPGVDVALFVVNVAAYAALWVLTVVRIARRPAALIEDLMNHEECVGFLAVVAATCVVGAQSIVIADSAAIATALLVLGVVLWLVVGYAFFLAVMVNRGNLPVAQRIDGGWLLAVVATEAIAVLLVLLALILHRYVFLDLTPADVTPQAWIVMGATAISALAGSLLVDAAPRDALLESLRPLLTGVTVLFWATGTWWIPLIAILAVWSHGAQRGYAPQKWSMVFPLGMYAVATHEMAGALPVHFLEVVAHVFVWIALAAWLLASAGVAARAGL